MTNSGEPAGGTGATAEIERLADVGRGYFALLAPDAELAVIVLDDDQGVCVFHRVRGGGKIYIAPDESALFVASILDFQKGLALFLAGTRTPPESFRPLTP
ncbi:hypothetical protein ACFXP7_06495 [Microbacterium sp. P06]|uniref:hypothetical protein n=1 Tax=unclassified Microbacterium TaxID=2609290 RepID=UPI00374625D2